MFSHHAPILHTPPPGSVDKHANVSHSQHFRDGVPKGPGMGLIIPNHYIISLGSQNLFTYESIYTDILREPITLTAFEYFTELMFYKITVQFSKEINTYCVVFKL